MELTNSYARLPPSLYERALPTPARAPRLLLLNRALADELGLDVDDPARWAQYLSGSALPPGAEPMALAYAGHQFGHFVPRLGDGRAHLLGELRDRAGHRRDVQLKGSGRTAFSRGGDGRAAVGPAVRELIMGEAMHALGVPTSRALAVVLTGEPVMRDAVHPGAVVTRVAASHLRVGTFQYAAARGDRAALAHLVDYAIERHDPDLASGREPRAEALLDRVIERQIALVVAWMRVGFIHGVMNTDNTAISGETIDYGPCAMLGAYDPDAAFSSIDEHGRYAFGQQPRIAAWNLARLAEALAPLLADDEREAEARARAHLDTFERRYATVWLDMMRGKLGLLEQSAQDEALARDLLARMADRSPDYTQTFTELRASLAEPAAEAEAEARLGAAYARWRTHVRRWPTAEVSAAMGAANPVLIPRNHRVETVLAEVEQTGRPEAAERLLDALSRPYAPLPEDAELALPPADGDRGYRTFCGT